MKTFEEKFKEIKRKYSDCPTEAIISATCGLLINDLAKSLGEQQKQIDFIMENTEKTYQVLDDELKPIGVETKTLKQLNYV